MPRKRITRLAVAAAAVAATALVLSGCTKVEETAAPESTFPEKDLRLIIQANPGGGSDLSSRALATEL
jgi:tripartite-type tricarboxylate transporter receptor subunit TctC